MLSLSHWLHLLPSWPPEHLLLRRHSRVPPRPSLCFLSPPNLTRHSTYPPQTIRSAVSSPQPPPDEYETELELLLALLPDDDERGGTRRRVREHSEFRQLIEVVMDLGRRPLARFPSGDFALSDRAVTYEDLDYAASQVGDFAIDNRAGISRTLHRISAIRNRKGAIVGLTCRVGRAVSGSANLLSDLLEGSSLLLIGPPGVGKTTIIREIARIIADDYKKRVMIVDTSNEIAGDGDIPHPGIGNARRMQVPNTDMQHKVMIEAVENHMPEVIVIDEIGTKLEAIAASTIAQRGIQLVATAHGNTIENLIMNPSLEMLVGGIHSVTLGDIEAKQRGCQKTVRERKGGPTFTCGVEIISRTELRIHHSLEATVDAVLSGRSPQSEIRKLNPDRSAYEILTLQIEPFGDISSERKAGFMVEDLGFNSERADEFITETSAEVFEKSSKHEATVRLFVYGILETTVIESIRQLKVDDVVEITDNISEASALLALNSKLKKNTRFHAVAKSHEIPIYVIKMSSLVQIKRAMQTLLNDHADGKSRNDMEDEINSPERMDAIEEARLAIEQVVIPKAEPVELLSRPFNIMCFQMDLIRKYQLQWEKVGEEPNVRLRILPFQDRIDEDQKSNGTVETDSIVDDDDDGDLSSDKNGSVHNASRLPLLPD